jgi:hypothetical protein
MTQEDHDRSTAIAEAAQAGAPPQLIARQVWEYYHDADRADRTPREILYLHMGILAGLIMRADRP